MLFDEFYLLPHGPIYSSTLNGIDGITHEKIWSEFLARNGNIAVAVRKFLRDDLDELSDAEIEMAESIWKQFGHKTASQLRNYSHENRPEYAEVEKGRIPILYRDILEAMGDPDAEEVDRVIAEFRRAENALMG
jgi:uncharacterized phage-associated protein